MDRRSRPSRENVGRDDWTSSAVNAVSRHPRSVIERKKECHESASCLVAPDVVLRYS
jgi:hypothetical protein